MTSLPTTPLFADPRRLLLEMAREHALPDLLCLIVDRLAESPRVALARIWLMRRSAGCGGCGVAAGWADRAGRPYPCARARPAAGAPGGRRCPPVGAPR